MTHEPKQSESPQGGSWAVALAALAVIILVVRLVAMIPDGAVWPLWAAGLGLVAFIAWAIIRQRKGTD
jgi:hypothetical protein